jgi:hypothetical protein
MKMEAHCHFVFCCDFVRFEPYVIWICVVIIDTIAMITKFCTMVLSVIQGIALDTRVLPFSKGRALQNGIRA